MKEHAEIEEIAGLRPGGIYLLRSKRPLRMEDAQRIQEHFDGAGRKFGCQFLLLDESLELVDPVAVGSISDFVIPARGDRKDIAISYDADRDWLVIDRVKVTPDLLAVLITNPDPRKMISCERKGDEVTCRQEMVEGVR